MAVLRESLSIEPLTCAARPLYGTLAAEMFVIAGAHFVVPDFAHVQDVGGSLLSVERQVRSTLQWVHDHADTFGGDARRIFVTGHSSGAHLAGAMLTLIPEGTLCGAMLVSGMYELRAPQLSWRSSYVKFDGATEDTLSPQRHIDKINVPLVVGYDTLETPEFQRQSREFAAAVKAAGKPVHTFVRG